MPRRESRTHTSIWNDDDFRALTTDAQRAYWLLYSQPNISLCGVLAFTPKRWAGFAVDDTPERFLAVLVELQEHRFILIDEDTQELFVRSFMRSDGVTPKSPKVWQPAMQQAEAVISIPIRDAIRVEVERITTGNTPPDTPSESPDATVHALPDRPRLGAHAATTPAPASSPTSVASASLGSPTPTPTQLSRSSWTTDTSVCGE